MCLSIILFFLSSILSIRLSDRFEKPCVSLYYPICSPVSLLLPCTVRALTEGEEGPVADWRAVMAMAEEYCQQYLAGQATGGRLALYKASVVFFSSSFLRILLRMVTGLLCCLCCLAQLHYASLRDLLLRMEFELNALPL